MLLALSLVAPTFAEEPASAEAPAAPAAPAAAEAPAPPEAPAVPEAPTVAAEAAEVAEIEDEESESEIFVGGGLQVRGELVPDVASSAAAEAEANMAAAVGIFVARVDLDVTTAFIVPAGGDGEFAIQTAAPDVPVIDTIRPEWAMVGLETDSWLVHAGIHNTAYGLDDWDDWSNYMPTHAAYYATSAGRVAGGEVGLFLGEGATTLTVGGGMDLDYGEPMACFAINVETDTWATWSGLGAYPTIGQYDAIVGAEFYPAEVLTIAFGGMGGVAGMLDGAAGSPFVLGSLYGILLPEAMINPTIRVEGAFDPDGYTGAAPWGVGVGGAVAPFDWLKVMAEAKVQDGGEAVVPGAYISISVFRPEEEEEEE